MYENWFDVDSNVQHGDTPSSIDLLGYFSSKQVIGYFVQTLDY